MCDIVWLYGVNYRPILFLHKGHYPSICMQVWTPLEWIKVTGYFDNIIHIAFAIRRHFKVV